jgi:hypothetical protein
MASSEPALADLASLREAIDHSPIWVRLFSLKARLADWEHTRTASDIDDVVLAWLASEGRSRRSASVVH